MIERTRKRPRVKSVRFHTFWWLLHREAVLRIICNTVQGTSLAGRRSWLASCRTDYVRRLGERLLRYDRGRRYWP